MSNMENAVRLANMKLGEKFIFRGVLCAKANLRDTGLRRAKQVSRYGFVSPMLKTNEVIVVNLKNGSLYRTNRDVKVVPAYEKGIK